MSAKELANIFRRERRKFCAVFPHVKHAGLAISEKHFLRTPARRDVAWAEEDGTIVFIKRALKLPRKNLIALVRHELAHIADFSLGERATDQLAEKITGKKIRYDKNRIQTL